MSGPAPAAAFDAAGPTPLYQQVKDYVRRSILTGAWPVDHRIPSENELVRLSGASRMTVHRALRELKDDGWLRRVQGQGTFVADRRARLDLLEIRNIADVIRRRGAYSCDVIRHERALPSDEIAEEMETGPKADLFHSRLVHRLDGAPFQLEDRWVNPAVAPDYLGVDLTRRTPNEYLMRAAPLSEVEHRLEAVLPGPMEQHLLGIGRHQPCLLLHRRTWSGGRVASRAWLTHPGDRFYLATRFAHDEGLPRSPQPEHMP
ncbi:MAG: histidine utilization repressor [Rhodospirillaceae bacterium]|nr:histidine utilization repressor [Rhodospirillaceae bacterium]MYB14981.1 histidine utilization repressor [Rhodospirillaceae bacterium]MYI47580.1 histidine utilization repressor [Rhodospirillaceae bacterium]